MTDFFHFQNSNFQQKHQQLLLSFLLHPPNRFTFLQEAHKHHQELQLHMWRQRGKLKRLLCQLLSIIRGNQLQIQEIRRKKLISRKTMSERNRIDTGVMHLLARFQNSEGNSQFKLIFDSFLTLKISFQKRKNNIGRKFAKNFWLQKLQRCSWKLSRPISMAFWLFKFEFFRFFVVFRLSRRPQQSLFRHFHVFTHFKRLQRFPGGI